MGNLETIQLRIFGRDLTLSCPSEEKDQLQKSGLKKVQVIFMLMV